MNGISGVQGVGGSNGAVPRPIEDSLGQQDFLLLMITQLRNQDPFQPMENGDFLSQMAQFSTVTGIQDLQKSFDQVSRSLAADRVLQAASLVDRTALVPGDIARFDGEAPVVGALELPASASAAWVSVRDANGQLVTRIPAEPGPGGRFRFEWDGTDANGNQLGAGDFRLEAQVQIEGKHQSVGLFLQGRIESVSLSSGADGVLVNLHGIGTVPLSKVVEIS